MKVCDINIYLTQLHYTYMYIYSKYVLDVFTLLPGI